MLIRIDELKNKEVISVSEGNRIGYVSDVEIDSQTSRLSSLVIYGKQRFFGFLGREDDCIIPWDSIAVIGEDTVLVKFSLPEKKHRQNSFFSSLFEFK